MATEPHALPSYEDYAAIEDDERFGVAEFWIVPQHEDRIEGMRLGPDGQYGAPLLFRLGDRLTSPHLPGFELDVAAVFPDDE